MIAQATLSKAYTAAGYTMTPSQFEERYNRMQDEWQDLAAMKLNELIDQWETQTGRSPIDAMTRGQLMQLGDQMAWDEIKEIWLDPLTHETIQIQLDEDAANPPSQQVLNSPDLWMTHWDLLPNNDPMWELACRLWPDATARWLNLATALLQVCDHQGKPYPAETDSSLIPEFEKKIRHAMTLN